MTNKLVLLTIERQVAIVTLNRADKANALHGPLIMALRAVLQETITNDAVKIVLLQSAGAHFCAGADIAWMCDIAQQNANDQDALQLAQLMYEIYQHPKPVIVLAQGATRGGGLGLVAASDIAIGATDASFSFAEVKIGLAPSTISPYILAAIGARATRYYFLTGEQFNATKAEQMGLLHQVAPLSQLLTHGMQLAERLLENSYDAMLSTKQLLRDVMGKTLDVDLLQMTAEHLASVRATADAQEGLAAFLQKRKPRWR